MIRNLLLWAGILAFWTPLQAQEYNSKAYLVKDGDAFTSGMRLGIHLDIDEGWHTYWKNPGDVGAPAQLDITSSSSITQSELIYSIPSRIKSEPFDFYGYEHELLVYKTLTLDDSNVESVQISARFDWLICKVSCIPCSKTFDITLPVKKTSGKADKHFDAFYFPKTDSDIRSSVEFKPDQTILTLSSSNIALPDTTDFLPGPEINQIFNKPTNKQIQSNKITLYYPHTKSKDMTVQGLVRIDSQNAYWIDGNSKATPAPAAANTEKKTPPILTILILAFIGGILLNFMPCVLPVVSLKILSTLQSSGQNQKKIKTTNLLYALGICTSIVCLALVFIGFRSTGENLGWGFQLQSPGFVTFLIFLFFLIGLNLIGYFEVPSISIPGIGKIFQSNSPFADFLGGFFMTLVATPCTAPFMAVAIGYALSQKAPIVLAAFLFLGIGLSFPYLLLATLPRLARVFPKPGAWMVKLKEILAFPMFMTVAWLVWLLNQLTHSKAVLFILLSLVVLVFLFWAREKLFSGKTAARKIFLLLVSAIVFVLAYIPLQLDKPGEIQWEAFDPAQVSSYSDTITLVDFTADWCITCKANERLTLSDKDVLKALQENHVRTVKADWTRRNPEITEILKQYDRAGVPLYLLYKPGLTSPQVLPTLLTPSIVMDAITAKGE